MTIEKVTSYFASDTKLYTADEVANILNITSALVRRYCRQKRLGQFVYGRWLISPDELERFKQQPRKVGNPNFGKK